MTTVTRIKNNQITDKTIQANNKVMDGSITGTLFNANLTIVSNIVLQGNLTVQGNTTTVNSTDTIINDPIIIFNSGFTGATPSADVGILVNRNSDTLSPYEAIGGINTAWLWREADGSFEGILTTEAGGSGSGSGSTINRSAYANLIIGNTTIKTTATNPSVVEAVDTNTGALQVKGGASFTQNVQIGGSASVFGANTGNVAISGNIPVIQVTQLTSTRPGLMITDTTNNGAFVMRTGAFGAQVATYGGSNNDIYIQPNQQPSLILPAGNGAVIGTIGINSTNANVGAIIVSGSGGVGIGGNINVGTSGSFEDRHVVVQSAKANDVAIGKNILKSGLGANALVIGTMLATTGSGTNSTLLGAAGPSNAGNNTTTVGKSAGNVSTGTNNQFFGYNAGSLITTGAYNVVLGSHDGNIFAAQNNNIIVSDGQGNPRVQIDNTGNVYINSSVESTNWTSGAQVVEGGVGIKKSLNVGQYANIGTQQSPGTTSLTVFGDTFMAGNLTVASNLFVLGSVTTTNSNTVTIEDSTIALHFFGNMQPLNFNDGKDIGVLGNYYKGAAQKAYFGWQNSTSNFVYIDGATESAGNLISGTYGNVQFGSLWLSNTTTSGSEITGTMVVKGGVGIGGNTVINTVNISNQVDTPALIIKGNTGVAGSNGSATNAPGGLYISLFQANSVLFMSQSGNTAVDQQNGSFNYRRTEGNTFSTVALTVGHSSQNDLLKQATDTFNIKYQGDSYLDQASIGANVVGQTPGWTVSTSRGTASAPLVVQDGDLNGLHGAYAWTGTTPTYSEIAAWRYVNQGTTAAASGIGGQAQLWTKRDNSASTLALRVDANQIATFYGQVAIANTTTTTNSTTGALYVAGGISAGGNIVVAQSARFNDSQTAYRDFYVRGGNDATLIWANTSPTYNQVIVGNSATSLTQVVGAKFMVNSSDSMMLSVGTTAQRPGDTQGYGSATAGMIRFNSELADMEYYTGSRWYSPQTSQLTAVTSDEFNGDGTTVAFTLQRSSSTNNVFVAINGVLQDPTYSYSVTGTTLTFTEAPAVGDVINARVVTLTSVIRALAGPSGNITVTSDNFNYAILHSNVVSGSGANITAFLGDGTVAWRGTSNVAVSTSPTIVHTFRADFYRSAKYTISVHNASFAGSGAYEVSEVMVIHDGTTAYRTQYNRVTTLANSGPLGSVTVAVSNGGTYANVNLYYTGLGSGNYVSVRADLTMYQPGSIYY